MWISDDQRITDVGLRYVGQLSRLAFLNLESNQISDEGLRCLRGLKYLANVTLYSDRIPDAGLEYLDTARVDAFGPSLVSLAIGGPQVTN